MLCFMSFIVHKLSVSHSFGVRFLFSEWILTSCFHILFIVSHNAEARLWERWSCLFFFFLFFGGEIYHHEYQFWTLKLWTAIYTLSQFYSNNTFWIAIIIIRKHLVISIYKVKIETTANVYKWLCNIDNSKNGFKHFIRFLVNAACQI